MSPFLHLSNEWKENEWKEVVKFWFKGQLLKEVLLDCSMQILLEQQPRVSERIRVFVSFISQQPIQQICPASAMCRHYDTFEADVVPRT